MITINMLPPEYRTVERTPLPIYLGLLTGVGLIAFFVITFALQKITLTSRKDDRTRLQNEVRLKKDKEKDIDELTDRIKKAQVRLTNVNAISQSKIYWSRKLDKLVELMPSYIWLRGIDATSGFGEENPGMRLNCRARGTNAQIIAQFLRSLRKDTNFIYHFKSPRAESYQVKNLNEGDDAIFVDGSALEFDVRFDLKKSAFAQKPPAPKKKKKR